ncbi:MAG TPA: DUF4331 family protein [Kofleriaceae bacterium]|jgi:hypothetical protein
MADIGDVYAWMTADKSTVNLVMTVSPADDSTRHFDNSLQYAFHVTSHPGANAAAAFGKPGTETNVICTFANDTSIQCWVALGTQVVDYVTGDPSVSGVGATSTDGKLKVFAGTRSDPFYFNLGGFKEAVATTEAAGSAGMIGSADAAGCPPLTTGQVMLLDGMLTTAPTVAEAPCGSGVIDCFSNLNVKAIVLQVDKSLLLNGSDVTLSVWGSTHAALN